jgi:hypothetical protein
MAYNFNPNFSKHFNSKSDSYKYIVRTGEENPYSNPGMYNMEVKNSIKKSLNFINNDNFEESVRMYKLEEIDHPNGWEFKELDMLGEMGFRIEDDYKMCAEVEVPSLQLENKKIKTSIYKTDEGYVIEINRKYVFETFNKMIEFIDSIPVKNY